MIVPLNTRINRKGSFTPLQSADATENRSVTMVMVNRVAAAGSGVTILGTTHPHVFSRYHNCKTMNYYDGNDLFHLKSISGLVSSFPPI